MIEPPVGLFDEIEDDSELHLGGGATLTLSHYASCQEVALEGGSVSVGTDKPVVEGGRALTLATVACPDRIDMAGADRVNMAVALRAVTVGSVMAPEPEFGLAGAWVRQSGRLDIYGGCGHVATLAVAHGDALWPADLAPLAIGASYRVVLNGPGATPQTARVDVTGEPLGMTVLTGK